MPRIQNFSSWILWTLTYTFGWTIWWVGYATLAIANFYYPDLQKAPFSATRIISIQTLVIVWLILGCFQVLCLHQYKKQSSWYLFSWLIVCIVGWTVFWQDFKQHESLINSLLFTTIIILIISSIHAWVICKMFPSLGMSFVTLWISLHLFSAMLSHFAELLASFVGLFGYILPGLLCGIATGYALDINLTSIRQNFPE